MQKMEDKNMTWGVGERKIEIRKSGSKVVELSPVQEIQGDEAMEKKAKTGRNLGGGMEMLDLEFLLGVIESTDGDDKNDVAMRRLSFNEVLRRNQQNEADSSSLTVYAVDDKDLYGKDIQCAAMKELTRRTEQKGS
jgi:hypothetical protein